MPFLSSFGGGTARAFGFTAASEGLPPIGSAYEGGFFAGQISTSENGVATHNLVVAPKSSGQNAIQWGGGGALVSGTQSVIDGPSNTVTLEALAVSESTPNAGSFCGGLTIGGYSDWYLPAARELEICYYNLKPTTDNNNTGAGTNTYAVPSRGSDYTTTVPGQTSATDFQTGNTEAYDSLFYWSSTMRTGTGNRPDMITFENGEATTGNPNDARRARAVRRVAI